MSTTCSHMLSSIPFSSRMGTSSVSAPATSENLSCGTNWMTLFLPVSIRKCALVRYMFTISSPPICRTPHFFNSIGFCSSLSLLLPRATLRCANRRFGTSRILTLSCSLFAPTSPALACVMPKETLPVPPAFWFHPCRWVRPSQKSLIIVGDVV